MKFYLKKIAYTLNQKNNNVKNDNIIEYLTILRKIRQYLQNTFRQTIKKNFYNYI